MTTVPTPSGSSTASPADEWTRALPASCSREAGAPGAEGGDPGGSGKPGVTLDEESLAPAGGVVPGLGGTWTILKRNPSGKGEGFDGERGHDDGPVTSTCIRSGRPG